MVPFVSGRLGGIQQAPRAASARSAEDVSNAAYALIAAIPDACASTVAPPVGLPPNRRAAK